MKEINVGLIGFGTVGSGVVKLLQENKDLISDKLGAKLILKKIADIDTTTDRGVYIEEGVLISDANELLADPEISIIIELIGGYEPAKSFVLKAIANGKHIVTANKALLALHGDEIFTAALNGGVEILFEAAVGGGIPVLAAIKGNMAANRFTTVLGILNGTCNYILTKMADERADFDDVLKAAQELGYAEADPTFDIEGTDTAHKLALLLALAFGSKINFSRIYTEGITSIAAIDMDFARQLGYKIKLLAIGKCDGEKIEARVHPTMLPLNYPLADVKGAFNAIRLTGDFVGPVMFYGSGAGMKPTASAVVGDVMDIARNIVAGVGNRVAPLGFIKDSAKSLPIMGIGEIRSRYYMRFGVTDQPGVLARIAGALGEHNISIKSMIQPTKTGNAVPIVIITHEAAEKDVIAALEKIDAFDMVLEKSNRIRIEDNLE
ncbi:MAG: homoserine dehydrogenase [Desulfuromonadales bacterium]|nr:homoserine dehydrogenase [Desulfuromonadales bacterium]